MSVEEVVSLVPRTLHQEDVGKDTNGGLPLLGRLLWRPLGEGRLLQDSVGGGEGRERRGGEGRGITFCTEW